MDIYRAAKRRGKYSSLSPTLRRIIVVVWYILIRDILIQLYIVAASGRGN